MAAFWVCRFTETCYLHHKGRVIISTILRHYAGKSILWKIGTVLPDFTASNATISSAFQVVLSKLLLPFSINSHHACSLRMLLLHHLTCFLFCLLCIFSLRVFYAFVHVTSLTVGLPTRCCSTHSQSTSVQHFIPKGKTWQSRHLSASGIV
jgi:hypothetical protein